MRIVICDDEQIITQKITQLIYEYYDSKKLKKTPDIVCYNNCEDLLTDNQNIDMLFLDIEMPKFNGIYIGKKIKEKAPYTIIIIITSYSEYLDDAMDFNVFRYLSKPIDKERFFLNFKNAIKHYQTISSRTLINTKECSIAIPISSIILIEALQKKVYIYTEDATYESTDTIKYWLQNLPEKSFFQTHRSFIVNFYHVVSFNNTTITLTNKRTAYLARRKHSDFKQAFSLFLEHL